MKGEAWRVEGVLYLLSPFVYTFPTQKSSIYRRYILLFGKLGTFAGMEIYFAIDQAGNYTASTSATLIARFLGCNAETVRRAVRKAQGSPARLKRGTVYRCEVERIRGRCNL